MPEDLNRLPLLITGQNSLYNSCEDHTLPLDEFDNFVYRRVGSTCVLHGLIFVSVADLMGKGVFTAPEVENGWDTQLLSGMRLM